MGRARGVGGTIIWQKTVTIEMYCAISVTNLGIWPECADQGLERYTPNSLADRTIGLQREVMTQPVI